jgi:hypothetical protein
MAAGDGMTAIQGSNIVTKAVLVFLCMHHIIVTVVTLVDRYHGAGEDNEVAAWHQRSNYTRNIQATNKQINVEFSYHTCQLYTTSYRCLRNGK